MRHFFYAEDMMNNHPSSPTDPHFTRHFTFEEAAGMVAEVRQHLLEAHRELDAVRDEIILFKRIIMAEQQQSIAQPTDLDEQDTPTTGNLPVATQKPSQKPGGKARRPTGMRALKEPSPEQVRHLKHLYKKMETLCERWVHFFAEKGIILRDVEQGLVDFPYYSQSRDETFLLCWKLDEDGLFYFHPIEGGFAGRQPISLLPE